MIIYIFLIYGSGSDDLHMLCRMIMNEWYLPAFGTLALSGASDWVRLHPYNISTILTPYVKNLTHHFFSDNSWMVF